MEKKNILQFSQVFQVPIDDVWKKTRFKERHFLVILDSASAPTVHPTDRGDPESLFNEAGVKKKSFSGLHTKAPLQSRQIG